MSNKSMISVSIANYFIEQVRLGRAAFRESAGKTFNIIPNKTGGGAKVAVFLPFPKYGGLQWYKHYRLRPGFSDDQVHNAVAKAHAAASEEMRRRLYAESLFYELGHDLGGYTDKIKTGCAAGHSDVYEAMTIEDIRYWAFALDAILTMREFQKLDQFA